MADEEDQPIAAPADDQTEISTEDVAQQAAAAAARGVAIGHTLSQMGQLEQQAAAPVTAPTRPAVQRPAQDMGQYINTMQRNELPQISQQDVAANQAASAQRQTRDANWYKPGGEGSAMIGKPQNVDYSDEDKTAALEAQRKFEAEKMYRFYTANGMPAQEAISKTGLDLFGGTGRKATTPQTKTHFGPNGQVLQVTGDDVKEVRPPKQSTRAAMDPALRSAIASERAQINVLENAQAKVSESDPDYGQNSYLLSQHRTKLSELEQKASQGTQAAVTPPSTATGTTPAPVQPPRNRIYQGNDINQGADSEKAFFQDAPTGARVGTLEAQRQPVQRPVAAPAARREVVRVTKDGKRAVFDAVTKKFIRYADNS